MISEPGGSPVLRSCKSPIQNNISVTMKTAVKEMEYKTFYIFSLSFVKIATQRSTQRITIDHYEYFQGPS